MEIRVDLPVDFLEVLHIMDEADRARRRRRHGQRERVDEQLPAVDGHHPVYERGRVFQHFIEKERREEAGKLMRGLHAQQLERLRIVENDVPLCTEADHALFRVVKHGLDVGAVRLLHAHVFGYGNGPAHRVADIHGLRLVQKNLPAEAADDPRRPAPAHENPNAARHRFPDPFLEFFLSVVTDRDNAHTKQGFHELDVAGLVDVRGEGHRIRKLPGPAQAFDDVDLRTLDEDRAASEFFEDGLTEPAVAQQDFVSLFEQAPCVFERRLVAGHLNGYVPPEKQRFPVYDIGDELGMDKRRNPVFLFHIRLLHGKNGL